MFNNQKKLYLDFESSLSLYEAGILFTKEELSGYWRKAKHFDSIRLILEEPMMKAIFPDDEITDWKCDNCKGRIEHEDFEKSIHPQSNKGKISCDCSNWITDNSKKAIGNADEFTWDGFIIGIGKIIPAPDLGILWKRIPSVITKTTGETYRFNILETDHTNILGGYCNGTNCWMDFYGNIEDPKTPSEILYFAHTHNCQGSTTNED